MIRVAFAFLLVTLGLTGAFAGLGATVTIVGGSMAGLGLALCPREEAAQDRARRVVRLPMRCVHPIGFDHRL
jgi:hypothetical protein